MDILIKGIVSGVIVMGVLWASRQFGATVGGIIAMVPAVSALSFLFTTYPTKSPTDVSDFAVGLLVGNMVYFLFIGALYFLPHRGFSYWSTFAIAYGAWLLGAAFYIYWSRI